MNNSNNSYTNNNNIGFFKVINNKFLINKIFKYVQEINKNENQISLKYNSIDSVEWLINNKHIELLYYKIKSNYKNLTFNKKSIVQLFKLIKLQQHNSNSNNSSGSGYNNGIINNSNPSPILHHQHQQNNNSNNHNDNSNNQNQYNNSIIKIIINNYFEHQLKYFDLISLLSESGNLEAIMVLWELYPSYYCNELAVDISIYNGHLEIVDYLLKRKCKYTESRLVSNSFQSDKRSIILCYLLDNKLLIPGVKNQSFTKIDLNIIEQYLFDVDFQVIQYFESINLFNSSSKQIFRNRNPLQLFKYKQNQLYQLYEDIEIQDYINQLKYNQQLQHINHHQLNNSNNSINNNSNSSINSYNHINNININNSSNSNSNSSSSSSSSNNNNKFLKLNNELNSIYLMLQIFILYQKKFNNMDYSSDLNLQDFIIQSNLSNSLVVEQFKRLYILFIKVVLHQNNKHQMFEDEDIYLLKARYAIQFNDITQLKSNLPLGKAFHDRYRIFSLLFEMSIEYLNLDILLELIKNLPSDFINSFLLKSPPDERLYIKPMKSRLLKNTLEELNQSRKETLLFIESLIQYYSNVIVHSANNTKRRSYSGIPKQSSFDSGTLSILRTSNPMSSDQQQQDIITSVIISLFDTMILHYPLDDISSIFKLIVDNEIGQYVDSFGTLKVSRNGAAHSASRGNIEIFQFIYNNRAHFHWDHEVFDCSLSKNPDIVQFLLKHMEHIINYQSSFNTATIYCNLEIIKILSSNPKFELSDSAYVRAFTTNEKVFEYLVYNRNEIITSDLLGFDIPERIVKMLVSIPQHMIDDNPIKYQKILSLPKLSKFKNPSTLVASLLSNEYFYREFISMVSSTQQDIYIQYQQDITPQSLSKLFIRGQYNQVIKPVLIRMFSKDNTIIWIQSNYHISCLKQIINGFIDRGQLSILKKLFKHFNHIFFNTTLTGISTTSDQYLNQCVVQWYNQYILNLGNYALEKEELNIFNYLAFDIKLFNFNHLNHSTLLHSLQNHPITFIDNLFLNYSIDSLLFILKLNNNNNNNNNNNINNSISNIKYIQSKYLNNNITSNNTLKSLKKSLSKLFNK